MKKVLCIVRRMLRVFHCCNDRYLNLENLHEIGEKKANSKQILASVKAKFGT